MVIFNSNPSDARLYSPTEIPVQALYEVVTTFAKRDGLSWVDAQGRYHAGAGEKANEHRSQASLRRFQAASKNVRTISIFPIYLHFSEITLSVSQGRHHLAALMAYHLDTGEQFDVPVLLMRGNGTEFRAWMEREFPLATDA